MAVEGAPAAADNPYVGLAAFTEADSARFHGRRAIVDRLWHALRDLVGRDAGPRILPVLGPSGSGKSSVARAGLLPELVRRPIPELRDPHVAVMTPRDAPLRELALVLARIDPSETHLSLKARDIERVLRSPAPHDGDVWNGLSDAAAAVAGDRPLIVLVDQFEELYTLAGDPQARQIFLATLAEAARAPGGRVTVVLTMRSDFIGATARDPDFNAVVANQGVIVPAMTDAELCEAIEAPAREAGRPLPRAVVDRLLDESRGRSGALPLMQFALQQVWNGMAAGEDPGEALARIGGVGGALASEAERILQGLGPEERQIARRAFLAMVSLGEGAQDTRRRAPLAEMTAAGETPEDVHRVLAAFSKPSARLVSLSGGEQGIAAEVTHEALFEHWDRLRRWLDESREDIRFQRQLNEAVEEWETAGRPRGMLWRPPLLTRLEDYRARNAADITNPQLDFLAASRRDAARGRMMRAGAAAVAALALLASGFGVFAWQERRQAEAERTRAETIQSRFLGNLSLAQTEAGDATTGALIALAAMEEGRPEVPEPEAALARALWDLREAWEPTGLDPAFRILGFDSSGRYLLLAGKEEPPDPAFAVDLQERTLLNFPAEWQGASLAMHPDEPLVAVGIPDQPVRLHSVPDWEPVAELAEQITARPENAELQFGPGGKHLYAVGPGFRALRWSVATREALAPLDTIGPFAATTLHFLNTGTAYRGGRFYFGLYDLEPPTPKALREDQDRYRHDAAASPPGFAGLCETCVLTVSVELHGYEVGVIGNVLWEQTSLGASDIGMPSPETTRLTFTERALLAHGENGAASWVALSPGSGTLIEEVIDLAPDPAAVEAANGEERQRDPDLEEDLRQTPTPDNRPPLAVSPDGRFLAVGGFYGQIALWREPASGPPLRVATLMLDDPGLAVIDLAFSPDGRRLASLDEFGQLTLWRVHPRHHWSVETPDLRVEALGLAPDGSIAASGGANGALALWDTAARTRAGALEGHSDWLHTSQFSADGTRLLTSAEDGQGILWDVAARRDLLRIGPGVWDAALAPDGGDIITFGETSVVALWSADGDKLAEYDPYDAIEPEPREVETITVGFPAGRPAALIRIDNDDEAYFLADPAEAGIYARLVNPDERPELAFTSALSPRFVAIAREDGSVVLFRPPDAAEVETKAEVIGVLPGHPNREIRSIAIAADGGRMLTAANDGSVRLWDLGTLSLVAETAGPGPAARAAAITPDGAHFGVAFGDLGGRGPQFLAFWSAPTERERLVASARALVPEELSPRRRREFFIDFE